MANEINLAAERRTITGKQVAQLRRQGVIPAVVYGHHLAATNIQIDERELNATIMRAGMNRLVNLQLGTDAVVALVREIQREPITQRVRHVDFQAVSMDEPITATAPIMFEGDAPALETGGVLLHAATSVEVRALPANLISSVVVNLSALTDYDAAIYVRDLVVPSTVEILADPDELVVKVMPPTVETEEEAATGEEASMPEVISETEASRRRTERGQED